MGYVTVILIWGSTFLKGRHQVDSYCACSCSFYCKGKGKVALPRLLFILGFHIVWNPSSI